MDNSFCGIANTYETRGAMLTGKAIKEAVLNKDIIITDYDEKRVNPNSYNMRLDPKLKVYRRNIFRPYLDMKERNPYKEIIIPPGGLLLKPNRLYIGSTIEYNFTNKFIPMINGRSSAGRLGLSIHITAGFGDIGFGGKWTLEITVVEPLIVYPGEEICQVCWFVPHGNTSMQYNGRYDGQMEATTSRFYLPKEEKYE